MVTSSVKSKIEEIKAELSFLNALPLDEKVDVLNQLKLALSSHSPFSDPIDLVLWFKEETVVANHYNPNYMKPPEKKLLKESIIQDGFTQPIVGYQTKDKVIIVDGFHRALVGRKYKTIRQRLHGYLPVTPVDKPIRERIACTVRHNRARGTLPLISFNGDDSLLFRQFKGLGDLFKNREFSKAWY